MLWHWWPGPNLLMKGGSKMHRKRLFDLLPVLLILFLSLVGCFPILPSQGGGQTDFQPPRRVEPTDVALLEDYKIEVVATGLTFPTGVAFDDQGQVYVTESGYSYGEVFTSPRLLRIDPDGSLRLIARGENPPWNGVAYAESSFYIAEGGVLEGGRILRVSMDGRITPLVENLPSVGDHHTNGPVVRDGWVYFGQGTATNSAVVGMDSKSFGWLERFPEFHDTPCEDLALLGSSYTTQNPLTDDPDDTATTGAFSPFGTPAEPGQVVPGSLPCNGAIMRVPADGGELELVAWGFRNPFGLAFSPDGQLYVTDNMYDARGSRPVFGTGDLLWRVEEDGWHGWPDFHGNRPLTDADQYQAPGEPAPGFVLAEHPNTPPKPAAVLGVHSSSNGLDFSRNRDFGFVGNAFIAEFGDMAPDVGKVVAPVGFKVIRVDVETGVAHDFAINRDPNGPASRTGLGGLERPVAVRFDPEGTALYVVDFGVMLTREEGVFPVPGMGVLWRITREGRQ
jgi:glucose/arabinose dehydrogenase